MEISTRKKRSPFNADLFGSVCCSYQHGKFRQDFGDLTRVDARLDFCSASAFAKKVWNGLKGSSFDLSEHPLASPRLNLIFQQQVSPLFFVFFFLYRVKTGVCRLIKLSTIAMHFTE